MSLEESLGGLQKAEIRKKATGNRVIYGEYYKVNHANHANSPAKNPGLAVLI